MNCYNELIRGKPVKISEKHQVTLAKEPVRDRISITNSLSVTLENKYNLWKRGFNFIKNSPKVFNQVVENVQPYLNYTLIYPIKNLVSKIKGQQSEQDAKSN